MNKQSNDLNHFMMEYNKLYKTEGSGLLDKFIRQDSLTKSSQKMFDMYGGYEIKRLQIYRTPISSAINSFLKVISFGKFNNEYDKLFHLALIATIQTPQGDKQCVLEKNATINISTSYKTNSDTEVMDVPLDKSLTIKSMLDNTLQKIGNKRFYLYDAFSTNCQQFLIDILNSNNLNNQQITNFVLQPLDKLVKNLGSVGSKIIPAVAKALTDTAAVFGMGKDDDGFELHSVKIPKKYKLEDAKAKSQIFIQNKNRNFYKDSKNYYVFRNIARHRFKKKSFKSKKSGDIVVVFGELLK